MMKFNLLLLLEATSLLLIILTIVKADNRADCGMKGSEPDLPAPLKARSKWNETILGIYGGQEAVAHEFPWIVQIYLNRKTGLAANYWEWENVCAGSIINKRWVITAAHCIVQYDKDGKQSYLGTPDKYMIVAGKHRHLLESGLYNFEPNEQSLSVEKYIVHEKYTNQNWNYDLALLRLDGDLAISRDNDAVAPICIPPFNKDEDIDIWTEKAGYAAGWGYVDEKKEMTKVLMKATASIWPQKYCKLSLNSSSGQSVTDKIVCWGGFGVDTCKGDSGGPLMVFDGVPPRWWLVGVNSFGSEKCGGRHPAFFIRISKFSRWIWSTMYEHTIGDDQCPTP